jgi:hypothetical protein
LRGIEPDLRDAVLVLDVGHHPNSMPSIPYFDGCIDRWVSGGVDQGGVRAGDRTLGHP